MFILVLTSSSVFGANGDQEISRAEYHEKLQGFWLGQCIANWTGLTTEGVRKTQPFFTDQDWGTNQGRNNKKIAFLLVEEGNAWGADDDTDIEYIFQEILLANKTSIATPEQIREGWLRHIKTEEPNFLWVSNEKALDLMMEGMLPLPGTNHRWLQWKKNKNGKTNDSNREVYISMHIFCIINCEYFSIIPEFAFKTSFSGIN